MPGQVRRRPVGLCRDRGGAGRTPGGILQVGNRGVGAGGRVGKPAEPFAGWKPAPRLGRLATGTVTPRGGEVIDGAGGKGVRAVVPPTPRRGAATADSEIRQPFAGWKPALRLRDGGLEEGGLGGGGEGEGTAREEEEVAGVGGGVAVLLDFVDEETDADSVEAAGGDEDGFAGRTTSCRSAKGASPSDPYSLPGRDCAGFLDNLPGSGDLMGAWKRSRSRERPFIDCPFTSGVCGSCWRMGWRR